MRVFCNTKSFLLKERALVMDEAREFWVSPPLDVKDRFSSLTGLGGSAYPVPANLLTSSSDNSSISGGGGELEAVALVSSCLKSC